MTRTMLTDEQWNKLHPTLKEVGVYDKENLRKTMEGILYRLRTGCPWRDLPKEFGKWSTVYQNFRYWRIKGKWQKLFAKIKRDIDVEWLFIDGSVVKAHQHSTGACSDKDEAIGKSVAGNSTKIHLVVDACGNPIYFELSAGQVHDSKHAESLIEHTIEDGTEAVVADKAYNSQKIRDKVSQLNSKTVIPVKSNSTKLDENFDKCLYRYRHLVENAFARLKHFRAIATRYDKLSESFKCSLLAAFCYIWLNLI